MSTQSAPPLLETKVCFLSVRLPIKKLPNLLIAVLLMLISEFAESGTIYKWTDENGQVHYSQTNPMKESEKIIVKSEPSKPKQQENSKPHVIPNSCASINCQNERTEQYHYNKEKRRQEKEERKRERERYAQEQKEKEQRRMKMREELIIANCKKRREVYCDKGVEEILKQDEWKRIKQELQKRFLRDHPYIRPQH